LRGRLGSLEDTPVVGSLDDDRLSSGGRQQQGRHSGGRTRDVIHAAAHGDVTAAAPHMKAGSAGRSAGPASAGMAVLIERETSGDALGTWGADRTISTS
jgi:hypothetical protein